MHANVNILHVYAPKLQEIKSIPSQVLITDINIASIMGRHELKKTNI